MKKYLLDTNVLISMFKNKGRVRQHIMDAGIQNCFISEISIAELFYGAAKGGKRQNMDDVTNVLQQFDVLPIFPNLKSYGQIKASLECKGLRIDDFDILIGATTLQNKLVMVTANIGHLNRIPNLKIENWE